MWGFGLSKGEIREYKHKRCCGLWFIIIGVVIIVSAIFLAERKNTIFYYIYCRFYCWIFIYL